VTPSRAACGAIVTVLAMLAPSALAAQELSLAFRDGRARLSARNVPASRILAEWARVGRTRVVNGERLFGPALTLELEWVPERVALDTILRSAGGYVAAPRPVGTPDVSVYDRILVMPQGPQMAGRSAPPPPAFPRAAPQPAPPQQDELPPETMSMDAPVPDGQPGAAYEPPEEVLNPGLTGPGEIAQPFAPGQDGDPLAPGVFGTVTPPAGSIPAPYTTPFGVPPGTARPGMISPPPPTREPNNPQPPPLEQ
jgi:hypothetical protein